MLFSCPHSEVHKYTNTHQCHHKIEGLLVIFLMNSAVTAKFEAAFPK